MPTRVFFSIDILINDSYRVFNFCYDLSYLYSYCYKEKNKFFKLYSYSQLKRLCKKASELALFLALRRVRTFLSEITSWHLLPLSRGVAKVGQITFIMGLQCNYIDM